jgi:hypothetical protein
MYGCNLYDLYELYMTGDSMERDKIGKTGGGLTPQYKHSANFIGDDIIVKQNRAVDGVKPGTR